MMSGLSPPDLLDTSTASTSTTPTRTKKRSMDVAILIKQEI